ncbi:MAG: hypothetical protein V3S12_02435 [Acidiferrobacterales bacterium]
MDITPVFLTLIFAFGFIVVAYDQFATSRRWMIEPWMMSNSFLKLSGVFSIFMAPALAFYLLPWWMPIVVIVAEFACFYALIMLLKEHVQMAAATGLIASWIIFAALLVNL